MTTEKKICILGGAGFIGTNLAFKLIENSSNKITIVDVCREYVNEELIKNMNVTVIESSFDENTDFVSILQNQDVVYHLISTTVPTTSNMNISEEINKNVVVSSKILDACVTCEVKKIIFISSGGTVYGKAQCPIPEDAPNNPISSYGFQKLAIEKLLYLYNYLYGLDYAIIRLANPYGPYQRPNGILGAVTTFTYKALHKEKIIVYGDGSVIRDFIFIDDAINAIVKIEESNDVHHIYNVGSGKGTSIQEVLSEIEKTLNCKLSVEYVHARMADVPANYLDIRRYEQDFGDLNVIGLTKGIEKTAAFMRKSEAE